MYKINITEWPVKTLDGKDGKDSLLTIINVLISTKKPDELPHGFLQFQLFSKLVKAFEKAGQTNVLELEENVYKFVKNIIDKDIPAVWGGNPNIVNAITSFMESKDE